MQLLTDRSAPNHWPCSHWFPAAKSIVAIIDNDNFDYSRDALRQFIRPCLFPARSEIASVIARELLFATSLPGAAAPCTRHAARQTRLLRILQCTAMLYAPGQSTSLPMSLRPPSSAGRHLSLSLLLIGPMWNALRLHMKLNPLPGKAKETAMLSCLASRQSTHGEPAAALRFLSRGPHACTIAASASFVEKVGDPLTSIIPCFDKTGFRPITGRASKFPASSRCG